jgi:hypothetical protein
MLSTIMAFISTNPSSSLPISTSQLTAAYVQQGSSFGAGGVASTTCQGITPNQLGIVEFSEGFPRAYKPQTQVLAAGAGSLSESGFIVPGLAGGGLADSGTRLKAVFSNIPAGVSLYVSTNNLAGTPSCANAISACSQLVSSEVGPFSPISSTTSMQGIAAVQLPVVNGTATAVWEVMFSGQSSQDTHLFAFFLSSTNTLPLSTVPATVTGSLAPSPPAFAAAAGGQAQPATFPVPRFVNTAPAPTTILSVTPCQTALLFPYVTTLSGFDSGMSISNTSSDPFATPAESGTCTLNFFGSNAPSPYTTPVIPSGATYSTMVSSLAPNFQGYIFASCNFEYAHAFAAITDSSGSLSMAYLALVVQASSLNSRGVTAEVLSK